MILLISVTTWLGFGLVLNVKGNPPDVKFIGLGYNLLTGNPDGGEHLHTDSDAGLKTTRSILKINAGTHVVLNDGKADCVPQTTNSVFYGTQSYQRYLLYKATTFGPGNDAIKPFAFTDSEAFKRIENATLYRRGIYLDVETSCITGRTRYVMPPAFPKEHSLNEEFISAMCNLPLVYDKDLYLKFLDTWGTHVVVEVETGASNLTQYELSFNQASEILFSRVMAAVGGPFIEQQQDGTNKTIMDISQTFFKPFYFDARFGIEFVGNFTKTVGLQGNPQPLFYKLATIAYFMDTRFFTYASPQIIMGVCHNFQIGNLATWQNNTAKAIADYAMNKGHKHKPTDPYQVPVYWPRGTYGLFKPKVGCPSSAGFEGDGYRLFDDEDHNNKNSWTPDTQLEVDTGDDYIFHFCVKTRNIESAYLRDWPAGSYCILKKGDCPKGLSYGSVFWDDEDHANKNRYGGTMPDGQYDGNTKIDFCCRNDSDVKTAIVLPIHEPFYLMQYHEHDCQEVVGMTVKTESFHFDDEDSKNDDSCEGMHPYDDNCSNDHTLHFCYYRKNDRNVFVPFG